MNPRSSSGAGWLTFSAIVLTIGGVFAAIDGLMAVYKSTFFTTNAVFVFSDLKTWGWITFGLGVAGIAAGLALFSSPGRQWARWTGIIVAGVSALGQLLFAQAYPLWALMIMAIDFLVIYGLAVYGSRENVAAMSGSYEESRSYETASRSASPSDVSESTEESRRAA